MSELPDTSKPKNETAHSSFVACLVRRGRLAFGLHAGPPYWYHWLVYWLYWKFWTPIYKDNPRLIIPTYIQAQDFINDEMSKMQKKRVIASFRNYMKSNVSGMPRPTAGRELE